MRGGVWRGEGEGCTVLASAESYCEMIAGADHPPEFYCISDPPFNLGSEMVTAQVTMYIPLVNDCGFSAHRTGRRPVTLQVQGISPRVLSGLPKFRPQLLQLYPQISDSRYGTQAHQGD